MQMEHNSMGVPFELRGIQTWLYNAIFGLNLFKTQPVNAHVNIAGIGFGVALIKCFFEDVFRPGTKIYSVKEGAKKLVVDGCFDNRHSHTGIIQIRDLSLNPGSKRFLLQKR